MAEFDEKLNSLLSDPGAMSQIMQLAQSLSGGAEQSVPLLTRLLPLIQELGNQNSNARQLLYALRPYLRPERQEKVERAIQLARLFHLGKKFLAGWGGLKDV